MTPYKTERQSTVGAAFGILIILAAIIGAIVAMVIFPQVLESVMWGIIIIVGAIVLVCVGIFLVAMFLIVPMYAKKGVEYQTGISYDIDDVEAVDGKMEGKK